jgi:hypothetical protein
MKIRYFNPLAAAVGLRRPERWLIRIHINKPQNFTVARVLP